MKPLHLAGRLGLPLVIALIAAALAQAAPHALVNLKLSGEMPPSADVMLTEFHISPDSRYTVYMADADVDELYEQFSVATGGSGRPVKLNFPLDQGGGAYFRAFTPDSGHVLYTAHTTFYGPLELYIVPVTGGDSIKLNGPFVEGGNIDDFVISPDGRWLVYRANQDTQDQFEIYRVPIEGGEAVKLNEPLSPTSYVANYAISPDGSRVVYAADQRQALHFGLYSVSSTGGTAAELSEPDLNLWGMRVVPGGDRVVFSARRGESLPIELYSVPIAGGANTKLNLPMPAEAYIWEFALTPDGERVVYSVYDVGIRLHDLYSVSPAGGAVALLNNWLGRKLGMVEFAISPDGSRVIFEATLDEERAINLYSVPMDGGVVTRLNDPLPPNERIGAFAISPDSRRVVFEQGKGRDGDEAAVIYSAPIAGGDPIRLSEPGDVYQMVISPDSAYLFYDNCRLLDGDCAVRRVPMLGGTPIQINGSLVAGGMVEGYLVAPDGRHVVYLADQETNNKTELFVTLETTFPRAFVPVVIGP